MKISDLIELLCRYNKDYNNVEVYTYLGGKLIPLEYFHIIGIGDKIII